ncbi:MAG: glycerol-3-phosphate dehydrogenase [Candidatus Cloacimonetes bacterium HGW-Cloacimonetes-1]|jgi:glycerol-3-phosphate dehydrogenase (NAD(P)+)|nr:MAG: glycerol-3-phosphate dehydrogenase [Candidatus Cloacimonetes bacterium HGW-Cloacimonetes-1]
MTAQAFHIGVLGGGSWGLTIAKLLAEKGHQIIVWEYNTAFVNQLQLTGTNDLLLPGVQLPQSIVYTNAWDDIIRFRPDILVLATPTQFVAGMLSALNHALDAVASGGWSLDSLLAIVNLAKGIEEGSLRTISQIIHEALPGFARDKILTLSGPSHAEEVTRKIPTTVVIAGGEEALLHKLQEVFSNEYFRVYSSTDQIGVEIGGAVKNIISIAAGILDGLGYGDNTKGALLTRGIVEIQRLGIAMGAKAETFLGLSGMGDLITTAISQHSRNRYVGFEIGKGKSLETIVSGMSMVAEGVATTASVYSLAQSLSVEMPIVNEVYEVLYNNKSPQLAIYELMTRDLKKE